MLQQDKMTGIWHALKNIFWMLLFGIEILIYTWGVAGLIVVSISAVSRVRLDPNRA